MCSECKRGPAHSPGPPPQGRPRRQPTCCSVHQPPPPLRHVAHIWRQETDPAGWANRGDVDSFCANFEWGCGCQTDASGLHASLDCCVALSHSGTYKCAREEGSQQTATYKKLVQMGVSGRDIWSKQPYLSIDSSIQSCMCLLTCRDNLTGRRPSRRLCGCGGRKCAPGPASADAPRCLQAARRRVVLNLRSTAADKAWDAGIEPEPFPQENTVQRAS